MPVGGDGRGSASGSFASAGLPEQTLPVDAPRRRPRLAAPIVAARRCSSGWDSSRWNLRRPGCQIAWQCLVQVSFDWRALRAATTSWPVTQVTLPARSNVPSCIATKRCQQGLPPATPAGCSPGQCLTSLRSKRGRPSAGLAGSRHWPISRSRWRRWRNCARPGPTCRRR
jgi:hypothetical protein